MGSRPRTCLYQPRGFFKTGLRISLPVVFFSLMSSSSDSNEEDEEEEVDVMNSISSRGRFAARDNEVMALSHESIDRLS